MLSQCQYLDNQAVHIYVFSDCSIEELEKLKRQTKNKQKIHIILKGLGLLSWKNDPKTLLIKWPKNVTQKVIPKIAPQLLLKKCPTYVIEKLILKPYSKSNPQQLLKEWSSQVTRKLAYKCYLKTGLQLLLKK